MPTTFLLKLYSIRYKIVIFEHNVFIVSVYLNYVTNDKFKLKLFNIFLCFLYFHFKYARVHRKKIIYSMCFYLLYMLLKLVIIVP